jgi:hypothetical protein
MSNPRAGVVKALGEIADKLVPMRTPAVDDKKKTKRLGR